MSDQEAPEGGIWPNDVLARGTTLNGYRVVRLLGRGGFGVTYLAEDVLGQHFALKEYFPRQFALRQGMQVHATSAEEAQVFDDCRSRFVHEARALVGLGRARSGQQDIVRVQTFFEANGTAYMVMEFIAGRTLQAAIRDHRGGMPAAMLRPIMAGILAGLDTVHAAGLMHRDIKPANILLRDDTTPVLIDFGSSREARGNQTHGFTQIFSGGYAPPEQIMGTRQGPFSDLYAVGAIGYEAIGGKVADALARQHALSARTPDPMPPASAIGAGRYDAALLAVIDAALAMDPAERPDSARAMARMLDAPVTTPAPAPRVTSPAPAAALAPVAVPRATPPPPPAPAPQRPAKPATKPAAPVTAPNPVPHPAPGVTPGRRRWPLFAGLGAAATVAAAAGLWFALLHATPPAPAPRPYVALPPPPVPRPFVAAPQAQPPELAALTTAAAALPCAVLFLESRAGDVLAITGRARDDAALAEFLREAGSAGRRVEVATEPVDPGLCPALPALAAPARRERERETLRLALAEEVVAGKPFAANLQGTGGGTLHVDLFGADGMAHHVLRRALPSGQWSIRLQATAATTPGQQLLVAIATAGPLDLGTRPAQEPMAHYLPALRRELDRASQAGASAPRAEMLFIQAAVPTP